MLEYRTVKIEKGLFLLEYKNKTAPFGIWHKVKNKKNLRQNRKLMLGQENIQ